MTAVCVCVFRYKRKNSRIYVYTRYTDNYSQIDGISYLVSLRNVWFSRKCEKKLCNSPSGNTQLEQPLLMSHNTHSNVLCTTKYRPSRSDLLYLVQPPTYSAAQQA